MPLLPMRHPGMLASTIMAMAMLLAFVDLGFLQSIGQVSKRALRSAGFTLGDIRNAGVVLAPPRVDYECEASEARETATWFVENGFDRTSCPKDTWLEAFQLLDPNPNGKLLINIGCNKGYNFLRWLNVWRPDMHICPMDWYNALGLDHCGACLDCQEPCNLPDTNTPRVWDYEEREDNMVIIGVDPNAPTLRPLEDSCKRLGLMDGRAGIEMHLVLAASAAKRGKAIMNEHCEVPGDELCQITNTTTDLSVPGLDIFPVDSLSEASSAIASILSARQKPIDILHIDTEGFDFEVLKGARRTLVFPGVRLLNFEYHGIGVWPEIGLAKVIAMLDDLEYDCFFQGQGRLFRLTGCFTPQWDIKTWSNVVCTRRRDPLLSVLESFRATPATLYALSAPSV